MKKRLISCHQIVKLAFLISLLSPVTLTAHSLDGDLITIILVRHAEKADNSHDPDLSEAGYERAEKLAEMFKRVSFDAVYSTNFKRTQKTAKSTADLNDLDLQIYDHQNPTSQVEKWLEMHQGETILVCGHSNSTPTFANTILEGEHFDESFDESDYGNILIITIAGDGERKLLHLRY
ncbi:MAG: phosphoglycerate mutase family protein [Balneolaceae bacterium]|nr:phosphoglycerate mutase family protein [Balneolaceae bacterium]